LIIGHIHDTHFAEHGHEPHSPEHQHGFDELKFYFYILAGIMFFILIDYLSILLYIEDGHNHGSHIEEEHKSEEGHKHKEKSLEKKKKSEKP